MRTGTTRQKIVEAADQLFYERGFDHTTFANIADVVRITRGNFYHHFKSKDDILDAVIEKRLADRRELVDLWQEAGTTPKERILCFIRMLLDNKEQLKQYGCPVGTLSTELAKLAHPAREPAAEIMGLFRDWLVRQFSEAGHAGDAEKLTLDLLIWSQGVSTLYATFKDDRFIEREIATMTAWLNDKL